MEDEAAALIDANAKGQSLQVATLGGGCFWCTEAVFSELKGVEKVEPGYSGGTVPNPTYEEVCSDTTGHAEVVQISFYPDVITYEDILHVFFSVHDPTTPNRQGADVGSQYRSVIFYHNDEQKRIAEKVIEEVNKSGIWGKSKVVTEVSPFKAFYRAEQYHREYFRNNPGQPYCRIVIEPKVSKFRKHYSNMLANSKKEQNSLSSCCKFDFRKNGKSRAREKKRKMEERRPSS